jgi:hypothetical protein
VLETLCSGGLVIARWDPLDEEPGETRDQLGDVLPLFHDYDEMVELLQRAVSDDAFREDLVSRGQARVLAEHTYQVRARKVLADLAPVLAAHLGSPSVADGSRPNEPAPLAHA